MNAGCYGYETKDVLKEIGSELNNNLDETFTYRGIPGDTANSVLHERLTNCCFVNTNDRMPQDNIGNSLPQGDLDKVANWILDDAKDITGAIPNEPNNLHNIKYYYVLLIYKKLVLDTNERSQINILYLCQNILYQIRNNDFDI